MKYEIVKKAYEKEVMLLTELCECLEQERRCLISGAIAELWPLKEKKEQICKDVRDQESIIRDQLKGGRVKEKSIDALEKTIINLKLQAGTRNSENMKIVEDALDFIDGLVDAITADGAEHRGYGKVNHVNRNPRILHKEA